MLPVAMLSFIVFLGMFAGPILTHPPPLMDTLLPNAVNASITFFTPHAEILEGSKFEFKCQIEMLELEAAPHEVEIIFVPSSADEVHRIAANGHLDPTDRGSSPPRLNMVTRRRWDAIKDVNVEEHYLTIEPLLPEDQGMYVCQIKAKKSGQSQKIVASKHSLLSVVPKEETGEVFTVESSALSSAPSHPLTVPTLGPITERFVVVKRGMDVVLECRDADGNWVYWRKHGDESLRGEGKHLRLFRVDRWDSGLYYCSTNITDKPHHNVTLQVEMPPQISPSLDIPEEERPVKVKQAPGHLAILTCKVDAYPVPVLTWFKIVSSDTSPETELQRLHLGLEYSFSISGYRDGQMLTSLHIKDVMAKHFGHYRCVAKNSEGEDGMDFLLEESLKAVDFLKSSISEEEELKTTSGFEFVERDHLSSAHHPRISPFAMVAILAVTYLMGQAALT